MNKKLIVGLGNPGKKYMNTPHNMGFAVIDELARRFSLDLRRSFRFHARLADGMIEDHPVLLAQPNTFMNLSGPVVAKLVRQKGFADQDLIVIADDANLPEGSLRVRPRGSSGGHNGMQSVINYLGHDRFARIRLGIGQPTDGSSLVEHVLTPFPTAVTRKIEDMVGRAAEAIVFMLAHGVEAAMNIFNKSTKEKIL